MPKKRVREATAIEDHPSRSRLLVGTALYDPRNSRFPAMQAALLARLRGVRTEGLVSLSLGRARAEARAPARLRVKAYPVRLNLPADGAGRRGKDRAERPDPMVDFYLLSFCGILKSEGEDHA